MIIRKPKNLNDSRKSGVSEVSKRRKRTFGGEVEMMRSESIVQNRTSRVETLHSEGV